MSNEKTRTTRRPRTPRSRTSPASGPRIRRGTARTPATTAPARAADDGVDEPDDTGDPASDEEAVADDPTDPDNSDEVWDDGIVVDDGPGRRRRRAGREEATGATSEGVTEANEGATSTSSAAQSRSKAPILTKIPTRTTCLADSRSIRLPSLRSPTDSSTKSSDRSTPAT